MHASNVLQALPAKKLFCILVLKFYMLLYTQNQYYFCIKRIYNQMGGDINEPWKKNEISLSIKMGDKNEATTFFKYQKTSFHESKG